MVVVNDVVRQKKRNSGSRQPEKRTGNPESLAPVRKNERKRSRFRRRRGSGILRDGHDATDQVSLFTVARVGLFEVSLSTIWET